MDFSPIISVIGLILIAIVAFIIARFLLRLAGRVVGCVVTAILAIGIVAIVWIFFL